MGAPERGRVRAADALHNKYCQRGLIQYVCLKPNDVFALLVREIVGKYTAISDYSISYLLVPERGHVRAADAGVQGPLDVRLAIGV